MKRTIAITLVSLGTIFFGVATGLVYVDNRALRVRELELRERWATMSPSEHSAAAASTQPTSKIPPVGAPVFAAMAIGPLGAGLGLAGFFMLLFELPWFRRGHDARAPHPA